MALRCFSHPGILKTLLCLVLMYKRFQWEKTMENFNSAETFSIQKSFQLKVTDQIYLETIATPLESLRSCQLLFCSTAQTSIY